MADDVSDDTLVLGALAGDSRAFVQLVRRYDKATRGTVFAALGPNGPIDDALQEGLLKAFRALGSYKQGGNFRSWLCRIVHNAAIDEIRRTRKVIPMGTAVDLQTSTISFDSHVVDQVDLRRVVDLLPEKQRNALILIDVEGFDYETASQILDVPAGTVASRVNTARAALRKAFASPEDGER